jgi:glutathione peroxidase
MFFGRKEKPHNARSAKSIYDYAFISVDGMVVPLSEFKGKKILIVNVASRCGFTPQYDDLEALYRKHRDKLVVIGFPANDFLGQEPGTNEEIMTFCRTTYDVTFPLSQKISVLGDTKADIFKWLTDPSLNGWNRQSPKWNFYKFLIDEKGELMNVFPSATKPLSKEIERVIIASP